MDIKKIWDDCFRSLEAEERVVSPEEDINEIIKILMDDKIDPIKFAINLKALLETGVAYDYNGNEDAHKQPTDSIQYYLSVLDRPSAGRWFLAGYPDVMHRINKKEREYSENHNGGSYDNEEIMKLMGLDINEDENQAINSTIVKSHLIYKNLIKHYKDETNRTLEVSVDEHSQNDIYLGAELLNSVGTENNLTFIAENTTKYYLELVKNHKPRFNNEVSILATAGVLDAQAYVFMDPPIIMPMDLMYMANDSVDSGQDPLIDFIMKLEVILLQIDNPGMGVSEIEDVCYEQSEAIVNAIEKTKEQYTNEQRFVSNTAIFMNSTKFKPYRKLLGIKNKFLWF